MCISRQRQSQNQQKMSFPKLPNELKSLIVEKLVEDGGTFRKDIYALCRTNRHQYETLLPLLYHFDAQNASEFVSTQKSGAAIFWAIAVNSLSTAEIALCHVVNVNRFAGCSLINFALFRDAPIPMIDLLFHKGADLNFECPTYGLPLAFAIRCDNIRPVQHLIELGADFNQADAHGRTPLLYVADNLDTSCDIHEHHEKQSGCWEDLLLSMLDNGGDATVRDFDGNTALHAAAGNGAGIATSALLHHGADINAIGFQNHTAIHSAVYYSHTCVVESLIQRGANLHGRASNGATLMCMAVNSRNHTIMRALFSTGTISGDGVGTGDNPLIFTAIILGNLETVQLLLDNGADPNDRRLPRGYSPLVWALPNARGDGEENREIIRALVRHGALLEDATHGQYPLHNESMCGTASMVRYLISLGAGVNVLDTMGRTPLDCAIEYSKPSIVTVLISRGARVTKKGARRAWRKVRQSNFDHNALQVMELLMGAMAAIV